MSVRVIGYNTWAKYSRRLDELYRKLVLVQLALDAKHNDFQDELLYAVALAVDDITKVSKTISEEFNELDVETDEN